MDAATSAVLPNLSHLTMKELMNVYEPAEDTYLLCDALLKEKDNILRQDPHFIMEIGCGSGCVITYLSAMLNEARRPHIAFATDINPSAIACTRRTASENNVTIDTVNCDLTTAMRGLYGKLDIVLFNPPYVPTPDSEVNGNGISAAWAGGTDGRLVIDRFIPQIFPLLAENGSCFLVLVKENKPEELKRLLIEKYDLQLHYVIEKRARNEHLIVVKIVRHS